MCVCVCVCVSSICYNILMNTVSTKKMNVKNNPRQKVHKHLFFSISLHFYSSYSPLYLSLSLSLSLASSLFFFITFLLLLLLLSLSLSLSLFSAIVSFFSPSFLYSLSLLSLFFYFIANKQSLILYEIVLLHELDFVVWYNIPKTI